MRLGSRATDILATLLASAGDVVTKDALVEAVWPNVFVDEANLRVHMSSLRKALGDAGGSDKLIENIPGRGYAFVAPVVVTASTPEPAPEPRAAAPRKSLPHAVAEPVGRDGFIAELIEQLHVHRIVTVTGPGGMGKTTAAIAAAHRLAGDFADGVVFVDFGVISDAAMVGAELRSAVEQLYGLAGPNTDVAQFLQDRRTLVVLDNCEHVVEEAARRVLHLLQSCPDIRVLATSREPLRVPGEWVARLPPLDLPPETAVTAAEVGAFAAARLFLDRASETLGGFVMHDADAPLVGEICRRLDGIALAIELAAGRIQTLGLRGLADALDDRFRLLRQGRRTALPRHQTLRATLDWSYGILDADEKSVLRRLATFSGGFSARAAMAVVAASAISEEDVEDILTGLIARSLVSVELASGEARYRLLETTRSYCLEKLEQAGEAERTSRLHAEYYAELFEHAESEWEGKRDPGWLARYAPKLSNLRAALDWAFRNDEDLAVRLAVAAIPLWFQLSLVGERLAVAQRAMTIVAGHPRRDRRQQMKLNVVLGWPQLHAVAGVESGPEAWRTVLEIARELDDTDHELRALWALWVDRTNSADHPAALSLAQQFLAACARGVVDVGDDLIGHRMAGRSLHLLGRQDAARESIGRMLDAYGAAQQAHTVRFQYDQRATAQSTLARILLLQGRRQEALDLVTQTVAELSAANDLPTLCHVLSDSACVVAMLAEDWELAVEFVATLRASTTAEMDVWSTYGKACSAALLIEGGELALGVEQLATALDRLAESRFVVHFAPFRAMQALGLARSGHSHEGLAVIDAEIERCRTVGEAWYLPELLRTRAEIAATASAESPERKIEALLEALALAVDQGALEWELRVATSLAQLSHPASRDQLERLSRRDTGSPFRARLETLLAGGKLDRTGSFTTLY